VLAANGEPPLVRRKDLESERAVVTPAGGGGARLLMIEFVVPPGDTPHLSKMSDLNMLAMLDGKERTETEWHELLTAADFTGIEIHQTGGPLQSSRQQHNSQLHPHRSC
jgi:hypothetical protein